MSKKPRFIMCNCTGQCPGFAKLDLWAFINRVRNNLDVEYAIVHPQLCVDDGDRFWRDVAKKDALYVVGACDPRMQRKMFGAVLQERGVDLDAQVISLDLRDMSAEEAYGKVKEAVAKSAALPQQVDSQS
jgi:heterodisulfide reductase subunit A-like polyferredoxin